MLADTADGWKQELSHANILLCLSLGGSAAQRLHLERVPPSPTRLKSRGPGTFVLKYVFHFFLLAGKRAYFSNSRDGLEDTRDFSRDWLQRAGQALSNHELRDMFLRF